ncbi:MAG: hypothetical protein QG599_3555 [Pseudomonadota bacterium]|nr:hypothetical protein [Pseudomonadota bacterium]
MGWNLAHGMLLDYPSRHGFSQHLLVWWNGIHTRLKILRPHGLVGSSPTTSTIMIQAIQCAALRDYAGTA